MSVSPRNRTIVRGDPASYTITVAQENGFAGAVQLSVMTTTSAAKLGLHTLTITGTSAQLTSATTATLQLKRR